MTPDQLIEFEKDKPKTLVGCLNGIYPSAVSVYPAPPIQKEAARRIVQLEAEVAELREVAELAHREICVRHYSHNTVAMKIRYVLDNKKPAEAG